MGDAWNSKQIDNKPSLPTNPQDQNSSGRSSNIMKKQSTRTYIDSNVKSYRSNETNYIKQFE